MCVHVSVLVSVYIIRVHCPLHRTLDTFYGPFAKKLKVHKGKYYKLLNVYILTLVQIKLQERNRDEYGMKWRCL
jgi:hypothetical protein